MWSWQHPNGAKAQLDHILMRCRWTNSLRNCRSYSSIEVDSDHRIVSASTKISLRVGGKKKNSGGLLDYATLVNDGEVRHKYTLQLNNHFSVLASYGESQQLYDDFASTINTTAETAVPKKMKVMKKTVGEST